VRQLLIVISLLGLGCQGSQANPAPLTRFHFPTGLAIDAPYGADAGAARFLYVAGFTNFDLAHDNGLVYALDLDAMTIGDGETPLLDALDFDAGWDGTPVQVPDLDAGDYWDRANGVVITDSMAGEMRLTTTTLGTGRLFMASRYSNLVTAIEADGGAVSCYGGGSNCNNQVAAPPLVIEQSAGANQLLDVFGISNEIVTASGEHDVFVTHLRDQGYGSGGVTSVTSYGNNFSAVGTAYVIRQDVDRPYCRLAEPVGTVGTSAAVALTQNDLIYTLFTGRYGGLDNAVRELTLPNGGCLPPDAGQTPVDLNIPNLFTIDLSQVTGGNDGRGMALSTSGDRAFALIRNPDALVVLRISGATPAGLLIHPSSVAPVPPGPTEMLAIPRTSASGAPLGDLVAISCADSNTLAFYDDELGTVTAALPNIGNEPFAIVGSLRTVGVGAAAQILPGIRLFVTDFGSGQIAVVDVPDLLDARSAQVVAFIGTWEDTSASPINPNNSILNVSVGGGPTGIP
jgi:hypothetical protein